ncbi:hypothetical protein [Paenibacillus tyrfis]|uniref:hypothetical protein n=1 Tax=Paenibacillus tyrfis TaxID=1501230 RepID=UPI0015C5B5F0|nr:hypothetical protein [Paenibacillus tyrfis]
MAEDEVRVAANAAALSLCKAIEKIASEERVSTKELEEVAGIVKATAELLSTITKM